MGYIDTDDERILHFNPWGDDDSDYRVLDNRFVITRKEHTCDICFETIPSKVRVRAQREVFNRQVKTFYFCVDCCDAMRRRVGAQTMEDVMAIEHRYNMGWEAANK